jgi:hypothetical protein
VGTITEMLARKQQQRQAAAPITLNPDRARFVRAGYLDTRAPQHIQARHENAERWAPATLCCIQVNGAFLEAKVSELRAVDVCPQCALRAARRGLLAEAPLSANAERTPAGENGRGR